MHVLKKIPVLILYKRLLPWMQGNFRGPCEITNMGMRNRKDARKIGSFILCMRLRAMKCLLSCLNSLRSRPHEQNKLLCFFPFILTSSYHASHAARRAITITYFVRPSMSMPLTKQQLRSALFLPKTPMPIHQTTTATCPHFWTISSIWEAHLIFKSDHLSLSEKGWM